QHLQIRDAASVGGVGGVAPNALEIVALGVVVARLAQAFRREARMRAHQRVGEQRPEPLVLPARVRHHPIEVVEHAGDQVVSFAAIVSRYLAMRWAMRGPLSPIVSPSSTM